MPPDVIESTPAHITNVSMPQAPEPAAAPAESEAGETTAIEALANQAEEAAPELTDEQKLEAEVKAEAEKREAEEKAKAEAIRKEKFEKAKRTAEKEQKRVAEMRRMQMEARRADLERQQYAQQMAQERAERERLQREFEALKADPLAAMEKLGVPAEAIAKRALQDSTPESKMEKMLREIEERQAALDKREQERAAAEEAARQRAEEERAQNDFLKAASNAEQFPALSILIEEDAAGVVREAKAILNEAFRREGVWYSDAEVRAFMEKKYSRLMTPKQKEAALNTSNVTKAPETNLGTGTPVKPAAGKPQTLTSRANTRAATPPSFDDLSDEEQKKVLAEQLRALRRSG